MDFVCHLTLNMSRAASTVKGQLQGIRWLRIHHGFADPLEGKPRLRVLRRSIARRSGVQRKWPVTTRMLRWIFRKMGVGTKDHKLLKGAMSLAWFFLLRLSEYAAHDGQPFDMNKVVRGADITFRKNGEIVANGADADEVGIRIRSSKADIFNAGEWRNHFRSDDPELCVVEALTLIQHEFPQRFGTGIESDLPLFRMEDGSPMRRGQIAAWLEMAADAEGYSKERFGSHSLRIGGATALYHIGMPVEVIKRYGRWASDSFQQYLWEGSEDSKGLALRMARDQSSLMVTRSR
jgi:hypothetical protein